MMLARIKSNISPIVGSLSGYTVMGNIFIDSGLKIIIPVITAVLITIATFFIKRLLDNKFPPKTKKDGKAD